MELNDLLEYRDAVLAIIADASIAAADKDKIVAEAIQGLNMTRLSAAPHLRSLIAKELHQHLDNLRKAPDETGLQLRAGGGSNASPTERPSNSGTDRKPQGSKVEKSKRAS
jgi:hypothetical protein